MGTKKRSSKPPFILSYYFFKAIDRICRRTGISILYNTKYGIKAANSIHPMYKYHVDSIEKILANDLFLDFDGLKDSFTLVNTCILDSPHFNLMKTLNSGEDPMKSEYCTRYSSGTLDGRYAVKINSSLRKYLEAKFVERKAMIESDSYEPVTVYLLNGKYYIADGKHRAALAALLKGYVNCEIISNDYLCDSYTLWIYRCMKKHKYSFAKNLTFLDIKYN